MNKLQTKPIIEPPAKPRRLGRGLSALLGEPVAVQIPAAPSAVPLPVAPAAAPLVEPKASVPPAPPPASPAAPSNGVAMRAMRMDRPAPTPAAADAPAGTRIAQIPVDAAEPNRFQPRRTFDEAQLKELAASIRSAGVVQPILVRTVEGSGGAGGAPAKYEIVAGERRWRAGKLAGLTHIPAVISTLSDEQAAEWALIENIQRSDLSAMERGWAIRGLCERFGLSHAQVADKLGIDRSSAANLARMTELESDIRELLDSGQISAGHGKLLLGAPMNARVGLAKQAASQGWSVRRLEQAITRAAQAPAGPAPIVKMSEMALAKAAALRELEKQLSEHLSTNVRIRASAGGKRGSLVIRFYDLDHFDSLMSKMGFALK